MRKHDPVVHALLDVLLPARCVGCGREGDAVCGACYRPFVRRLDEPPAVPLGLAVPLPPNLAGLEWCAIYSGVVRAALQALKYDGERRLVPPLATAMAARLRRVDLPVDLVVHVPVHRDRLRERGFDQAELLARALAARLRLPAVAALERTAETAVQHALGRTQRAENVRAAFRVVDSMQPFVAGRRVLLVDDIVTTGATMGGCASALLSARAEAVHGAAVARDR